MTTHKGAPSAIVATETTEWWYSQLLEHTHDAVIVWEIGGKGILYWNRAAEHLYGYRCDEVQGRITHELLQTEIQSGLSGLETAITRNGIWEGELRHKRRDGWRVTVKTRLVLLPRVDNRWLVAEFNREIKTG
jgi:PAS domain S-box-containing protein